MPMPRTAARLSKSTQSALFVLAAASDAGFALRAAGEGQLEVLGPPGLPDDLCQPTLEAIRAHGAEIQRLLRWLNFEAAKGRIWSLRPGPETRQ